jgi:hypothetical protein
LPVHPCARIGKPSDAARAAEISCNRNWLGPRQAPPRPRLLPVRRHGQAQHHTSPGGSCVHGIGRCAPRSPRAKNAASNQKRA